MRWSVVVVELRLGIVKSVEDALGIVDGHWTVGAVISLLVALARKRHFLNSTHHLQHSPQSYHQLHEEPLKP
jgi:hypothetical protein